MKKILFWLILLSPSLMISTLAQQAVKEKHFRSDAFIPELGPTPLQLKQTSSVVAAKGAATDNNWLFLGKSPNIFAAAQSACSPLSYNTDNDVLSFTYLKAEDGDTPPHNRIGCVWSHMANGFSPQETSITIDNMHSTDIGGQLYNPPGNTQAEQMEIVATGPVTADNSWHQNVSATFKLNGDMPRTTYYEKDNNYNGNEVLRYGLTVCPNGVAHAMTIEYQSDNDGYALDFNIGRWRAVRNDAGQWEWSRTTEHVDLAKRSGEHAGTTKNLWKLGQTFSDDGMVGYQWMIGQLASLSGQAGYQPIVWRTEDAGLSWTLLDINFAEEAILAQYLPATNQGNGPVWPLCTEVDGVILNNEGFYLVVKCTASASTHPDSTDYNYQGEKDYIFASHIADDESGQYTIGHSGIVSTLMTGRAVSKYDASAAGYAYAGEIGWQNNLHAFIYKERWFGVLWTDTPEFSGNINVRPDIYIAFPDTYHGSFSFDPPVNITQDDVYASGECYYVKAGKKTVKSGDHSISLPIVRSPHMEEMSGSHMDMQVSYFLLTLKCGFDGIEEHKNANSVSISTALPNPCLAKATFTIDNKEGQPLSISIYNMMGQQIRPTHTISSQPGQSTYELNTTDLAAGVYMCHFSIGNTQISRKLIKQ